MKPVKTTIPRKQLDEFARNMADYKTLYIQAPAGYGKTVFGEQWLKSQNGSGATATLDEYDNAAEELCHKLRGLPEALCPKEAAVRVSVYTRHPDFDKAPAEFLRRAAAVLPADSCGGVVIDDLHNLADSRALKTLHDFLARLPSGIKVCILSRNRLPDAFSGLALKQELGFIPQDMLLFDSSEIRALYRKKGVSVTEKQADQILSYTGGWPLGITALLLSNQHFPTESISSEWLESFLKDQVWALWGEDSREFMVGTCMEDTLSGSLCDALTGRSGSGKILELLLADGVFLSKISGETYQFHSLFLTFLRKQFLSRPEAYRSRQFRRAGEWYREQNDFYQAVRRFSWGNDYSQVAGCFDMLETMERAEFDTEQVMRAVHDTLDEEAARQYPFLYYIMAYTARNEGRTEIFQKYADQYYSNYPRIVERNPELAHNIFFLYALDSRFTFQDIIAMAKNSPASAGFRGVRGSATLYFPLYHRSFRDFSELLPGDIDERVKTLGGILGMLLGEERDMIFACIRGGLYYEKGDLQRARELALSAVAAIQNQFAPESKFCAMALLLAVSHAMNQPAQEALTQKEIQDMIEADKAYYLQHNFDAVLCRNRLDSGDSGAALSWLEHNHAGICGTVKFFDLTGQFTTARSLIALGSLNQAVILLEKILELSRIMNRPLDMTEAEILLSTAFCRMKRGGRRTALLHLEKAILIAQPFGYTQAFLNDGAGISPMMPALKNRVIRSDYGGELSETFVRKLCLELAEEIKMNGHPVPGNAGQDIRLTPQQKRVATLMCEGYSYRSIAKELNIQFSTVRSHIELIYRKLDVSGMDGAIRKIRELNLLDDCLYS